MTARHPFQVLMNPRHGVPGTVILPNAGFRRARAEITGWDGYRATPLVDLPDVAARVNLAAIGLKDEAGRFGVGSFKALGGAYAVANLLANALARNGVAAAASSADLTAGRYRAATEAMTVTCATDGNHGRSVAWGARRFHCRCVIFIHETVSQGRADAIAAYGAEVRRVSGTYDDAVREAAGSAESDGWLVASDTSWPGYTEVPRDIMQGYRVMVDEAADQWGDTPPTHIFIQAGVGGLAAAVSAHARFRWQPVPRLIVVESDRAACLLASATTGELTAFSGDLNTIMAGLACGEPSLLAWEELSRAADAFMAIPDAAALDAVDLLGNQGVVAGESGVAGLAACLLAAEDPPTCKALGLTPASRVVVFNTEGATGG